jgi:hypothetical protein
MMKKILKSGLKAWRSVAGQNTGVEKFLKKQYKSASRTMEATHNIAVRGPFEKRYVGKNFTAFWNGDSRKNRIGVYMEGSCDLPAIFTCAPMIHETLDGACCMIKRRTISEAHSSLFLQSLENVPRDGVAPVMKRLWLSDDYFEPTLFQKTFRAPGYNHLGEFPKSVMVFSLNPDVTRTIYRHREHGFLVDPGAWWFSHTMKDVLANLPAVTWFQENFESVGKISVEGFVDNFTKIVTLIKNNIGAHVLVLNVLTVEPANLTHNYQFIKNSPSIRRREFNLALVELSRKLDFSIVDVDRILKRAGIQETQVDFAHYPEEAYQPIGREAFRIMRDLGIF